MTLDEAAKEAAHRKEQEKRAAEEEKQRRRKAYALGANYQVKTPDLFNRHDVAPGAQQPTGKVMPYGKYKGQKISSLNTNYIKTFLEKVPQTRTSAWVFDVMRRELDRRGVEAPARTLTNAPSAAAAPATEQQRRVLSRFGKPCDVSQADAVRMIGEINNELAEKKRESA